MGMIGPRRIFIAGVWAFYSAPYIAEVKLAIRLFQFIYHTLI